MFPPLLAMDLAFKVIAAFINICPACCNVREAISNCPLSIVKPSPKLSALALPPNNPEVQPKSASVMRLDAKSAKESTNPLLIALNKLPKDLPIFSELVKNSLNPVLNAPVTPLITVPSSENCCLIASNLYSLTSLKLFLNTLICSLVSLLAPVANSFF